MTDSVPLINEKKNETQSEVIDSGHKVKAFPFILSAIAVVMVGCFWLYFSSPAEVPRTKPSKPTKPIDLYSGFDHVNGESLWVSRAEDTLKAHQVETQTLKTQSEKASQQLQAQQQLVEALEQHIELLESQLAKVAQPPKPTNDLVSIESASLSEASPLLGLRQDTLTLTPKPSKGQRLKNSETYVPAGSYVQAVLLNGLTVSAAVTAQNEPRPVLMRVTSRGSLPAKQQSHLTDCRLIGAAVGDVSSERAYIRLERMSCQQEGEFTDHSVYGYVSGPDGRTGILGKVILRDSAMMGRAFVGGLFGSLSHTLSSTFVDSSSSALGTVNSVTGSDAFKVSGAEGVSNAMDSYARYNIKRAEQYQPVIEIPAGVTVEVVFHKGFFLDGFKASQPSAQPAPSKSRNDMNNVLGGEL